MSDDRIGTKDVDHLATEPASASSGHPAAEDAAAWILKHIEVGRLDIQDGDILIIRMPDHETIESFGFDLREGLRRAFYRADKDVPIMMVTKDTEFQVLCHKAAQRLNNNLTGGAARDTGSCPQTKAFPHPRVSVE
jgi:hypothetical protein